ncbi:MAG: CBS domain-containing protein, partial [Burkholderiales bacterium]|nr:CBS domain-containing protein [Burkholderiales bacterium]
MLVNQILKLKPEGGVVSIAPGATVAEAATLLSARRIGCLVVSEDGVKLSGILSERDIVRELGKRGPSCMSDTVKDIMTSDIKTCVGDDDGEVILERMTEGRFRHMPVIEGGAVVNL